MSTEEFIKYIESIGFRMHSMNKRKYSYRYYDILIGAYYYTFNDRDGLLIKNKIDNNYIFYLNDVSEINSYFKNELRSIKLKKILNK